MSARDMKYGRRPPKDAPSLKFAAIRDSIVPTHPTEVDTVDGWGGWKILGNDSYGDCVAVTWATERRIVTRLAGHERYPGIDEVVTVYRTQNPRFNPDPNDRMYGPGSYSDEGMEIQTLLEYLVTTGGPDRVKALAFAKVDHEDIEEVKAALAIFNCVWIGLTVTRQNEDAFDHGEVWDYDPTDEELGGHSITGTGYNPREFYMETWADEGYLTHAYMTHRVDEAWIVVWPEHGEKLTAQQRKDLDDAFYSLTRRHIDWSSVPSVEPLDTDPPDPIGPDEADRSLASAIRTWLSNHPFFYKWFQKHVQDWLDKKGL